MTPQSSESTLWLAALLGATLVTTSAAASSCVSRSMAKRSMKIAAEFASAMFGIWLGERPLGEDFRDALLGVNQ
ncbi:MAG: chalcone isomerase family protein [Pseudomonadota bacterium]|nr:chalcone isomerase family protein [Pseudomonadota bacterium]